MFVADRECLDADPFQFPAWCADAELERAAFLLLKRREHTLAIFGIDGLQPDERVAIDRLAAAAPDLWSIR